MGVMDQGMGVEWCPRRCLAEAEAARGQEVGAEARVRRTAEPQGVRPRDPPRRVGVAARRREAPRVQIEAPGGGVGRHRVWEAGGGVRRFRGPLRRGAGVAEAHMRVGDRGRCVAERRRRAKHF
eukprot:gene3313-biopygen998